MTFRSRFLYFGRLFTALFIVWLLAVQTFAQAPALSPVSTPFSPIESELAGKITIASIKEMTTALSAPEMEGRGTGQPGGEKAANWIAERFKSYGLKPLGDKGSYFQKVDFKETVTAAETSFTVGDQSLAHGSEFAFVPQNNGNKNVSGEMVFVSYGIQASGTDIDQLKGVSISGKVIVMLEGPPPGISEKIWTDQKFQMSIMQNLVYGGAAAIVFIGSGNDKRSPEENISYLSRRQLTLQDEKGYPAEVPPFVYVSAAGADKLFAKSGVAREQALRDSATREFKPINLKQKAKIVAKYSSAKVSGNNVVGYSKVPILS